MKKFFFTIILFSLAATMTACSSSGGLVIKQSLSEPIDATKTISIDIKSVQGKESEEDMVKMVNALKEKVGPAIVAQGDFLNAVMAPNKGDYNLLVTVKNARIVSTAARIAFGVMAGPSSLEAEVLLVNPVTNKQLLAFDVEGSTAAHPLSSEVGYENAVKEAANNVAKALKK